MKKSFKLSIASIFAVLLLVGIVSGAMTLIRTDTVINVDHNSQVTINFNLTHGGSLLDPQQKLNWSASSSDIGNWIILPTLLTISDSDGAVPLSATLNIPEYVSGTINANINVKSNTSDQANLPIIFTIKPSPSLTISSGSISQLDNSTTITIKNTGNVAFSGITLNDTGDFNVEFNDTAPFSLLPGKEKTILVTADTTELSRILGSGTSTTITATASDGTKNTGIISYTGEYCAYENYGNNIIMEIDDIMVVKGYGYDDEWFPLDKVRVIFNIEYLSSDSDNNLRSAELRWGLYNTAENKFIIGEERESSFRLRDGDYKEVVVEFTLDRPRDLQYGGDYILFAKVTGEDEENDREKSCASDSWDIRIDTDDTVIFANMEIPVNTSCGLTEVLKGEIWNIGDSHQDDIRLIIQSTDLNIHETYDYERLRSFNSVDFEFLFDIPSDYDKSHVRIAFEIRDEDGYIFEIDGKKMSYTYSIKVEGGCIIVPDLRVTPVLESEAVAGKELIIKTTIENTGTKQHTLTASIEGLSGWAELESIDKTNFLLSVNGSEEITIKLNVDKGIKGTETFMINLLSADGSIYSQPVSVTIEDSGFNFVEIFKGNSLYWIIGAINVVLIIAIIVVLIKIIVKKN